MKKFQQDINGLLLLMRERASIVEDVIKLYLAKFMAHKRLIQAMEYSVLAGGKRIRPFLVIETGKLLGCNLESSLHVGAAVEAIHCYSLIHDDLPALDNDSLRRGKPTLHIAFDEATALLAGDALLTMAFGILSGNIIKIPAYKRIKLIESLTKSAGIDGMIGGQMLDLAAEGRFDENRKTPTLDEIKNLQSLKTGALIEFSVMAGVILAKKPSKTTKEALQKYSSKLGLAFQIKDDLLDIEGSEEKIGKKVSKDAKLGKATFVDLLGVEGARKILKETSQEAIEALSHFGNEANILIALMNFNYSREI